MTYSVQSSQIAPPNNIQNSGPPTITSLPHEVILKIFLLLEFKDRLALASSCKLFYNAATERVVWERFKPKELKVIQPDDLVKFTAIVHNSSVNYFSRLPRAIALKNDPRWLKACAYSQGERLIENAQHLKNANINETLLLELYLIAAQVSPLTTAQNLKSLGITDENTRGQIVTKIATACVKTALSGWRRYNITTPSIIYSIAQEAIACNTNEAVKLIRPLAQALPEKERLALILQAIKNNPGSLWRNFNNFLLKDPQNIQTALQALDKKSAQGIEMMNPLITNFIHEELSFSDDPLAINASDLLASASVLFLPERIIGGG